MMKDFSMRAFAGYGLGLIVLSGLTALAQVPGGSPAGMNAGMLALFGKNNAFTAKAEAQMSDGAKEVVASVPMDFAMLDNKIRAEIDMTQAKNKNAPPGMIDALKRMGLAHVVTIVRPDKKVAYVIYPEQKMLLKRAFSAEDAASVDKTFKIAATALGKETFDGHECVKNKSIVTDDQGQKWEFTTWNAADLKDFPIQIQTTERQNSSSIHFSQVKLTKPEATLFEPPTGYTEYKDEMEMMQGLTKKLGAGEEKK